MNCRIALFAVGLAIHLCSAQEAPPVSPVIQASFLPKIVYEPLTETETARLRTLLVELGHDSYRVRERAQKELAAFGARALPWLEGFASGIGAGQDLDLEVEMRMEQALKVARQSAEDQWKRRVSDYLACAIEESPYLNKRTDPAIRKRMERKIAFELVDVSFADAVALVERHTGVPIILDPMGEGDIYAAKINLRVTDMESDMALGWICRLGDREWTFHNGAVIVASAQRIVAIGRRKATIRLPTSVDSFSHLWTIEETMQWANILGAELQKDGYGRWMDPPPANGLQLFVVGPGEVSVNGSDFAVERLSEWISSTQGRSNVKPVELESFETLMRRPMRVMFTGRKLDGVLGAVLDGKFKGAEVDQEQIPLVSCNDQAKTLEQWAEEELQSAGLVLMPRLTWRDSEVVVTCLQRTWLEEEPVLVWFNFDLVPCLNQGVDEKDLEATLRQVQAESPFQHSAALIQGRWIGFADFWTLRRLSSVLDPARIRHGALATPPPAPWFLKELKKLLDDEANE